MPEKIRILVADDHPLFREGIVHSLNGDPNFEVVGEAGTTDDAVEATVRLRPQLVLLDITMPGEGCGIAAAARIADKAPGTRIVMLTVSENQDHVMEALKAGAHGYVLKGVSARELCDIARRVAEGEVYVSAELAAGLLVEMSRPRPRDPLSDLTAREAEILDLVAQGFTNREIGEKLFLAEKTVKHYMTSVLQKLQVRSRTEAALLAVRHTTRERE